MANPEEKLRKYLQEIAEKENYKPNKIDIKAISSEGANYTTVLFLATITDPSKPDLNLFAKVANINEEFRSQNAEMAKVYMIEGIFYTDLSDNFERIYNNNNVPVEDRLLRAKYYGHVLTPLEETLVLENLEAGAFVNFDRMKTFNWDYASTAVTQLAKFHAIGLAFKHESPMKFEEVINKINMNFLDENQMVMFFEQAIQNGVHAVKDEYLPRLQKYLNVDQIKQLMAMFLENSDMLIHGDFRPSNLMHRRRCPERLRDAFDFPGIPSSDPDLVIMESPQEYTKKDTTNGLNGGKLHIITLDYQTIRMGNPVADLMYFIFSGSDEEFRRLHYRRLLDHYFRQLTLALRQVNVDVEEVYPKKTFELDLIQFQPLGLMISLAMIPLFVVDPAEAPKIEGIEDFHVKPNQRALERINGIVKDFAKWGVI